MRSRITLIILLMVVLGGGAAFAWSRSSHRAAALADARTAVDAYERLAAQVVYVPADYKCAALPFGADEALAALDGRAEAALRHFSLAAGEDAPEIMDLSQGMLNAEIALHDRDMACLVAVGKALDRRAHPRHR